MIGMVMEVKPVAILRRLVSSDMEADNVLAIISNYMEYLF